MTAVSIHEFSLPAADAIHVLAPHPDDFDAVAVVLSYLAEHDRTLYLSVLTGGENGVVDGFDGVKSDEDKQQLRQREQLASCELFGLSQWFVRFLNLPKSAQGSFAVTPDNCRRITEEISRSGAGILILPHGNDSNSTHQFCAQLVVQACQDSGWAGEIWFNRDEKTLAMRDDLYIAFDEDKAHWKAELLRAHRSQQHRNQITRGHGFDERVLRMNAETANRLGIASTRQTYAESFEISSLHYS